MNQINQYLTLFISNFRLGHAVDFRESCRKLSFRINREVEESKIFVLSYYINILETPVVYYLKINQ